MQASSKFSPKVQDIDAQLMLNYRNISSILQTKSDTILAQLRIASSNTVGINNVDNKEHQVLAAIAFSEMMLEIYEVELQMDYHYMKRNTLLDKSIKAYSKFVEANEENIVIW